MLEPDGNAFLVAQNTKIAFGTDVSDLSRNSQPVNIAFAAELSRARDSISDQATDVKLKNGTPADPKISVKNVEIETAPEDTDGPGVVPQRLSDSSTPLLQNHGSAPVKVADLQATLTGIRPDHAGSEPLSSIRATQSLTGLPATTVLEPVGAGQTLLANTTVEAGEFLRKDTDSLSFVYESNPPAEVTVNTARDSVLGAQGGTLKTAAAGVLLDHDNVKSLGSAQATDSVAGLAVDTALNPKTAELDLAPIPVTVVHNDGSAVVHTKIAETIKTSAIAVVADLGKVNAQDTASKTLGDQADNAALLYKPSPALNKSGLGRISVGLNNDANLVTQKNEPAVAGQPVVNSTLSPPVPLSPRQPPDVISNSVVVATTDKVATVPGHEFLRSIGAAQTEPRDQKLSKSIQVAGTVPNQDQSKSSVTIQALSNTAPISGLSSTSPQTTLAESAVSIGSAGVSSVETNEPASTNTSSIAKTFSTENFTDTHADSRGAKNSHQQQAEIAATTADEDVSRTLLRESVAVEHQNKSADVTPAIGLRKAANLYQKPDFAGVQSLNGPAEVTSSNVYHVTTNGIITANSTPLNTGHSVDIASAPRTLLLDQPDADQSLVDNLRWAVNEKLSRVTINVTPANLGPITVSVDLENQNMSVSIITNNAVSKEAIDSLLPRLREHFADEGYQVSVDVSSQQDRQNNLRNQSGDSFEHEGGAEADPHNNETVQDDNIYSPGHQRASKSLIDTYV